MARLFAHCDDRLSFVKASWSLWSYNRSTSMSSQWTVEYTMIHDTKKLAKLVMKPSLMIS